MKKSQSGFTLVELMIVLVIIGMILMVIGGMAMSCSGCGSDTVRTNANKYARNYVRQYYGWQQPVLGCQGVDTDNNGYVGCNVSEHTGMPPRQIECPANMMYERNTECRLPMMQTVNVNNPQQVQQQ